MELPSINEERCQERYVNGYKMIQLSFIGGELISLLPFV